MKKEHLYIIPITDVNMRIENEEGDLIQLYDYTFMYYPVVKQLERARMGLVNKIYSEHKGMNGDCPKMELQKYAAQASIPLYLIAVGNDYEVREIITNRRIVPDYPAALSVRRQKTHHSFDKIFYSAYDKKVLNFLDEETEQKVKIKARG